MEDNNASDNKLIARVEELEKRIQKIEDKMQRDKKMKRIIFIIYIIILIGIFIFAYFYYNNIYSSIIGILG